MFAVILAGRLAHTIKGVAGNISANEIQRTAADLETAIQQNTDIKYPDLLSELGRSIESFNKLTTGLSEAKANEPPTTGDPLGHPEVETLLQDLYRLIEENNVDAEKTLDELQKRLKNSGFDKEIQAISASLGDFELEAAKAPLQKIAAGLNIVLGGN